jgi:cytochrome c5
VTVDLPSLAHLHLDGASSDVDHRVVWSEYQAVIEHAITQDPRTLQTRIGPSGLGTECDWCLGHMLAGIPERRDVAWLPTIGKAVHVWLEEAFTAFNAALPAGHVRYLLETRVAVGEVDGVQITGNADVYDLATRTLTDWKITGVTTMRKARRYGASQVYRRQQHLYARGLTARGLTVDRVQVAYLPRNEPNLGSAYVWGEAYDEQVALDTLARADALARAIRLAGPDVVLPQLARAPNCFSCPRYPAADGTAPEAPGRPPTDGLAGLIATATPRTPDTLRAGTTAA